MLLLICVVPLTILLAYLLIMTNKISSEYDGIVRRITRQTRTTSISRRTWTT